MAKLLKRQIKKEISELMEMDPDERVNARINKYSSMGVFATKPVPVEVEEKK
jgi:acetyl-CoA carboxylase carboxyl transferase subunit alpha